MTVNASLYFNDEAEFLAWGRRLAGLLKAGDFIGLSGNLGAGKTTLTRGILRGLGYEGEVSSPSFAIVHPYDLSEVSLPVLHCDFYRLERPDEVEQLGLDDYHDSGVIIAEWPEKAPVFSGAQHLTITISVGADGVRWLTFDAGENWKERLSCME